METENKPIWFTTGNPFVDTGQEMMASLSGRTDLSGLTIEDAEKLLSRIADLYMKSGWRKNMYTLFPNSKLANGSVKRPREEYLALLKDWYGCLIADKPLDVPDGSTCSISGETAAIYVSKMYLPMSDYGSNNFQSGNVNGVPVSAAVALSLQFFPLALVKVGKMMALPHFSNSEAQARWADSRADEIDFADTVGAGGVGEVGTSRPVNAFFRLVERLVRDQRDFPKSGVTLYLFNNFNQVDYKAATDIHYMPAGVFGFIKAAMSPSTKEAWHKIVWRGYPRNRKVEGEDDALRRFSNSVYERLLDGRSISGFFINRRERCPVVRGQSGWILFRHYLEEVRGLDRERIENLRELGDRIAPIVRNRKSRLLALEGANSRGRLTDVLYRIATKDSAGKLSEPLITFDQLVTDLFPHDMQYSDWREVKYLLLFRIYEQLFDDLKDDRDYANANVGDEPDDDDKGGE